MSRRWKGARPTRPRRWDPPWPQIPHDIPQILTPARRRPAVRTRRGTIQTVPPGPQWIAPPLRPRPHRAPRPTRRGTYTPLPPAPTLTTPPGNLTGRRPHPAPARRGTIGSAPPGQATGPSLLITYVRILPGWWTARPWQGGPVTSQSALSLQYVPFAVTSALGDPTAYTVEAAFAPLADPTPGTWCAATWVQDAPVGTYVAQCLVGPGGTIQLDVGDYVCYLRITANPEIPVLQAGALSIQ
jgi:hypothetical protein